MMEALKQAFEDGGWPMYVNLFMSAIVVAIIAERVSVLFIKGRRQRKEDFVTEISGYIKTGEWNRAITFCDGVATPLSRIVKAGIVMVNREAEHAQAAMDEASLRELPQLERRTGYLAMLGNVVTLVGLFGTILGLIHAFAAVSSADPSEKAALLARGISEAMNNTAFGLGIAIPALIFFSVFQGRTQRLVDDINEAAVTILNKLHNTRKSAGVDAA